MNHVLIVDDERIIQELFSYYIQSASDRYCLVDAITSSDNAELYCVSNDIDLILMDVCTINHENGIAACQRIKQKYPHVKVIIVTSAPDYRLIDLALRAGADSFWYKEVSPQKLIDVMDKTMSGQSVYPEHTPVVKLGMADSTEFTPKELEVLYYLVQGMSISQIAKAMNVEYTTTKSHLNHIKDKTGARTITELAVMASHSRIVVPDIS